MPDRFSRTCISKTRASTCCHLKPSIHHQRHRSTSKPPPKMRSFTLLSLVTATTLAYSDIHLPWVTTHQPQGVAAGQVNYWNIALNITSNNTSPSQSGYCTVTWPDNTRDCGNTCVPYSTAVPLDWTTCYANSSTFTNGGNRDSPFSFQLSPYFAIGNFSIALRENVTEYVSLFLFFCCTF